MNGNEIIEVAKMYPIAFKELNVGLVEKYFAKNATKTGFIYDYKEKNWLDLSTIEVDEIKEWVLSYNKEGIMPDDEIDVILLDVQERIAVVKIEMFWAEGNKGCDYVLLVKENGVWVIDKVLYQSILSEL